IECAVTRGALFFLRGADIEGGIQRNLRMLIKKGNQRRVGCEKLLVGHQGRIFAQDMPDRRRVPLEQFLKIPLDLLDIRLFDALDRRWRGGWSMRPLGEGRAGGPKGDGEGAYPHDSVNDSPVHCLVTPLGRSSAG